MIEQVKVLNRRLISDERGWFLKAINGTEEQLPTHTGEIYLTMENPVNQREDIIILKH